MGELSGDRCYGCGCDDGYRGIGFYVSILVPVPIDPTQGVIGGHAYHSPKRLDAPDRIAYSGILCTRCSQKDDILREFALASGDRFADDHLRGAIIWAWLPELDDVWVRVTPAHLAKRRAEERRLMNDI